jgi:hypothetical protein
MIEGRASEENGYGIGRLLPEICLELFWPLSSCIQLTNILVDL